jgi:hypothetical protein
VNRIGIQFAVLHTPNNKLIPNTALTQQVVTKNREDPQIYHIPTLLNGKTGKKNFKTVSNEEINNNNNNNNVIKISSDNKK